MTTSKTTTVLLLPEIADSATSVDTDQVSEIMIALLNTGHSLDSYEDEVMSNHSWYNDGAPLDTPLDAEEREEVKAECIQIIEEMIEGHAKKQVIRFEQDKAEYRMMFAA